MRLSLLVFCLFLAAPAGAAQLAGVVVDASGAPIAGASVSAGSATVTTADSGEFVIPDAPADRIIRVSAPGFAAASVMVDATTVRARVVLQPAPLVQEVVVTASRGADRLSTPAATSVVTSAELLNNAAGSLDDALRSTPGFSLFRRSSSRVANPTTQGVTLRGISGSGSSRTLVLADGIPLNDPFGSWVYWNRVPQAAIDRVEIVRGAAGDLYGADALGGVVQVLTFQPGRTRVRGTVDAGSHDTVRLSGYGGAQRNAWSYDAAGEWLRTGGVITVGEEVRGPIDVPADSDYETGFLTGGYSGRAWHATARLSGYSEDRGNGTPAQINTTSWTQLAGEAAGSAADGAWTVRASGGSQDYYQTFSAVSADRTAERLTTEQTAPTSFATLSGQWSQQLRGATLLAGADGRWTDGEVDEIRYSTLNVRSGPFVTGGRESLGALFGRISLSPRPALTLVAGLRGDFWRSVPADAARPTHRADFLSPRVSASYRLSDEVAVEASAYRSHRTPTLNELHRGFRVGNIVTVANPALDPESLTGAEGGALWTRRAVSARVTAFWNQLGNAITNVTVPSTTPGTINRERQNTDTARATGVELEADIRPVSRVTLSALAGFTHSTFAHSPAQPAIEGNRIPQVPTFQLGASVTYVDPRGFTGSVQTRAFGSQYDDDLNTFLLDGYGVVDASAAQELRPGVHVFAAVENLFDADYDTGRTPIRTIGWPRTARFGVRLFLP